MGEAKISVKAVTLLAMHVLQKWKRFGNNVICRREWRPDTGDCLVFKDMGFFGTSPSMYVYERESILLKNKN